AAFPPRPVTPPEVPGHDPHGPTRSPDPCPPARRLAPAGHGRHGPGGHRRRVPTRRWRPRAVSTPTLFRTPVHRSPPGYRHRVRGPSGVVHGCTVDGAPSGVVSPHLVPLGDRTRTERPFMARSRPNIDRTDHGD